MCAAGMNDKVTVITAVVAIVVVVVIAVKRSRVIPVAARF